MQNFWYEFGFNRTGVIVSNYALWLIEQFKKNDIDQVLLFARDGFIIKELFDIYSNNVENLPKYDYVLASRRAFLIPALNNDLAQKDFLNILGLISLDFENLEERLFYLGLNPKEYESYFDEFKTIAFDKYLSRKQRDEKLLETALIKKLEENISQQCLKEKTLFESYLNKKNILSASRIAVVDGFGHGSCQYYFEKMLSLIDNGMQEILGFYMATYAPYNKDKKYENINQKSYMFDFAKYDFTKMPITDAYVFELVFGSQEGSFIRFDDDLKPVFDRDFIVRKEIIEQIHNGVKDYFKEYLKTTNEPLSGNDVLNKCFDLMRKPSLAEAINIGNIPVIDADVDRGFCIAKPEFAHLFKKGLKYLWKEAYYKRLNPFK